jgi:hypothetical protein
LNRLHHPALRSVHVGFTFTAMSPCPVVDPATFAAADAMQAVYFRGFLDDERRRLVDEIANREAELVKRTDAGQLSAIGRLRAQIRAVQTQLRYVDQLVERLNGRFGP